MAQYLRPIFSPGFEPRITDAGPQQLAHFNHNLVAGNQSRKGALPLWNIRWYPMNQAVDHILSKHEQAERLVAALTDGLYLVNTKGEVLCVLQDVTAQRRSNGGVMAMIAIADTSAAGRAIFEKFGTLNRGSNSEAQISTLDELTERERQVLGLICEGRDDQGMSDALGLSRNTVRNHIAALYRRIGVNRRAAAILWAQERSIAYHSALTPRPRKSPRRRQLEALRAER